MDFSQMNKLINIFLDSCFKTKLMFTYSFEMVFVLRHGISFRKNKNIQITA